MRSIALGAATAGKFGQRGLDARFHRLRFGVFGSGNRESRAAQRSRQRRLRKKRYALRLRGFLYDQRRASGRFVGRPRVVAAIPARACRDEHEERRQFRNPVLAEAASRSAENWRLSDSPRESRKSCTRTTSAWYSSSVQPLKARRQAHLHLGVDATGKLRVGVQVIDAAAHLEEIERVVEEFLGREAGHEMVRSKRSYRASRCDW